MDPRSSKFPSRGLLAALIASCAIGGGVFVGFEYATAGLAALVAAITFIELAVLLLVTAYSHRGWSRLALLIGVIAGVLVGFERFWSGVHGGDATLIAGGVAAGAGGGLLALREAVLWVRRGFSQGDRVS